MRKLKNNFSIVFVLPAIIFFTTAYWFFIQKPQIESFQKQIDSIKINQNSPVGVKDSILMKRDLITLQNTLNNSLFQFVSGLFLFSTAYIAWRNLVVSEKKQIVESFAKAVDQLSSNEVQARVGGILILEQIAHGSPEYHWTVIEVLMSYIRDLSLEEKSTSKPQYKVNENYLYQNTTEKVQRERLQKIMEEEAVSVTIDVQIALTVICRRNNKQDPKGRVIDLKFCDIRGAYMENANLANADLTGAKISRAKLQNVNFANAKLEEADLTEAILDGSNLNKSSLRNAVLEGASLEKTDLQDSDLAYANFTRTHLKKAKLNRALLHFTNFLGAELYGANLSDAKLKLTNLIMVKVDSNTKLDEKWAQVHKINNGECKNQEFKEKCDFTDAILLNANFEGCTLKKARFERAYLQRTNFKNANLEQANFDGANLEGVNFNNANLKLATFRDDVFLNLKYANFGGAFLQQATFKNVDFRDSNFIELNEITDMTGVRFEKKVNFANVNFENLILEKAEFVESHLYNTSFCKAKLKEAEFKFCYYKETNFKEAELGKAKFIFRESMEGANFDDLKGQNVVFEKVDI
jgi:uncharacterized protein YjbI with pentapeptide repeats